MFFGIHLTVYLLFQMIAVLLYKWGSTDPKYYWWGFIIGNIFSLASIFSFMYVHKGLHPNIALAGLYRRRICDLSGGFVCLL